jgi:hypothetical protein
MRYKLKFLSGPHKGKTTLISENKKLTIGRLQSNTIVINDTSVSRTHCQIEFSGVLKITDLGALNSTKLNGIKLSSGVQVNLDLHDVVQVGNILIVIVEDHISSAPSGMNGLEIDSHFKGQLGQIGVVGILQFLNSSNNSGVIYIDGHAGAKGIISMVNGNVVGAKWKTKTMDPMKAFARIVDIKFGDFVFLPGHSVSLTNSEKISLSFENLMMETMRQIDELSYVSSTMEVSEVRLRLPTESPMSMLSEVAKKVFDRIYQQILSKEISMSDVMDDSFLSNIDTYKIVIELIDKGFLETRIPE